MTQEHEEKPKYEDMSSTQGERDIDLPDEKDGQRGFGEAENDSPNQSDLQATLRRLFPTFSDTDINDLAQAIMVSRLAPDAFMDTMYLTVVSILMRHDPREKIDVMKTINTVYAVCSIGLSGKGRADAIELHGSAKEEAELESLSKGLNF